MSNGMCSLEYAALRLCLAHLHMARDAPAVDDNEVDPGKGRRDQILGLGSPKVFDPFYVPAPLLSSATAMGQR